MTKVMTVADSNANLPELVAAVQDTHDSVEITRNGEPVAVLLSVTELEALRETVAILSDPQTASDVREGMSDILAGRVTNAEDIRDAMLARRLGADG